MSDLEQRKNTMRKVALFKCILGHIYGIMTALAELYIGEKVSLR